MPDVYAGIAARSSLAAGYFRVVVSAAGKISQLDFDTPGAARSYADDVASEATDEPQLAFVYDSNFVRIYEGRPYYMK